LFLFLFHYLSHLSEFRMHCRREVMCVQREILYRDLDSSCILKIKFVNSLINTQLSPSLSDDDDGATPKIF
jgi:hypothetical protein